MSNLFSEWVYDTSGWFRGLKTNMSQAIFVSSYDYSAKFGTSIYASHSIMKTYHRLINQGIIYSSQEEAKLAIDKIIEKIEKLVIFS